MKWIRHHLNHNLVYRSKGDAQPNPVIPQVEMNNRYHQPPPLLVMVVFRIVPPLVVCWLPPVDSHARSKSKRTGPVPSERVSASAIKRFEIIPPLAWLWVCVLCVLVLVRESRKFEITKTEGKERATNRNSPRAAVLVGMDGNESRSGQVGDFH